MAGLGRMQQRFNAALVAVLALAGLRKMTGVSAKEEARNGTGHPIHAKYLRTNGETRNTRHSHTPGYAYCGGESETRRRLRALLLMNSVDPNDNVAVQAYLRNITKGEVAELTHSSRPDYVVAPWWARAWHRVHA